jgi:hypothetical protein
MQYLVTVKKLTVQAFRDGTLTSPQGTPADTEEGREREAEGGERESSYRGLQGNHFWGRHIHILSKRIQQGTGEVVFILPLLLKG